MDLAQKSPAGWYPDPEGGPGQRYWDGDAWTDQFSEPPAAPSSAPAWYRRPKLVIPLLLLLAAVVGFALWSFAGGSSGTGGGATSAERKMAEAVAHDLLGDNVTSLPATIPSQIPKDFPLPADAKVVAAFASSDSKDTVSVTFTTGETDPDHFVRDRLTAAGYEGSSDFRMTLGGSAKADECSTLRLTNGFFRDGDLVGLITTAEQDTSNNCKATITVAVGPDVVRSAH